MTNLCLDNNFSGKQDDITNAMTNLCQDDNFSGKQDDITNAMTNLCQDDNFSGKQDDITNAMTNLCLDDNFSGKQDDITNAMTNLCLDDNFSGKQDDITNAMTNLCQDDNFSGNETMTLQHFSEVKYFEYFFYTWKLYSKSELYQPELDFLNYIFYCKMYFESYPYCFYDHNNILTFQYGNVYANELCTPSFCNREGFYLHFDGNIHLNNTYLSNFIIV